MQAAPTYLAGSLLHRKDLGDRYLTWLGWALLGYALLGRGFAYLGVAPLYIGEATMLFGLLALARAGNHLVFKEPLVLVLLALMGWGALCTIPYLAQYGITALRDAALWGYGCFAIITAGLLMQHPERLKMLLIRYRRFVLIFGGLIWLTLALKLFAGPLPKTPGSDVPIVYPKNGDALVHITGIAAFIIIGMGRARPVLVALLLLAFLQGNRAGMLTFAIGITLVILLAPSKEKAARFTYVLSCALVAIALFMPTISIGDKTFATEELWEKVTSIFTESQTSNYDNTETWRLQWWGKIIDYTVNGPYFWTGKGYGINLSVEDGFTSGAGESLRSPHNSHMTVLARSGVPGFLIWIILHGAWLWGMLSHYLHSRRTGDAAWAGVFAFLIVYFAALMINACFDVVLESPVGGIWLWTLFGAGVAAMHVHTYHPDAITLT